MIVTSRFVLLAALFVPGSIACGAEPSSWTEFRGPNGTGRAANSDPPITFGEAENLKWKTAVPGKAWSSPVVAEGRVWVTNSPADGKKLSAVALELETGKVLHDVLVFDNPEPPFCHPTNSYASSTPALEPGRAYVHFGSQGTAALDAETGKVLWTRRDLKCDHFRGPASSPILHGNLLYALYDGYDAQYVVAFDKRTGETVWKRDRAFDFGTSNGDNKKGYGTPSVLEIGGRSLLICPAAVATEAFEPETGKLVWTVHHGGMNVSARPLLGDGRLFLTNGMGKMIALKPEGEGNLKQQILWESVKGISKKASPILDGDLLYMVSDAGVASAVDAKTSDVVWSHRLPGEFASSPVLASGRLYFCGLDGTCTVMATGREAKVLASNKLDSGCRATPAVVGDSLIVRNETHVYRFEKPTTAR